MVSNSDTILIVKNKIEQLLHLEPNKQRLIYKNAELKNTDTVEKYNIETNTKVILIKKLRQDILTDIYCYY